MNATTTSSRIKDERGLYRPEVFEYQKKRFFGKPINIKPMSLLLVILPLAGISSVLIAFLGLEYRPRVRGQLSRADGAVVLREVDRPQLLTSIKPGDELSFIRAGSGFPEKMRVAAIVPDSSTSSIQAIRVLLPDEANNAIALSPEGKVSVTLTLPPRRVASDFK